MTEPYEWNPPTPEETNRVRETRVTYHGPRYTAPGPIASSRDVVPFLRKIIPADALQERFVVVHCDAKNRAIGWHTAGIGGMATCPVSPGAALRAPLLAGAHGVIFCHNHPSGDPMPSPDDIALTERLIQAATFLGIRVLDHIIIGDGSGQRFSFLDAGLMPCQE